MSWRLVVSPPLTGAENMAIDEAIMNAVREERVPPTVRLYSWHLPTLSIGAFQRIEREVNVERCKELGVDIVRRPTGGRAVLHEAEVTYSFIVREDHPLIPPGVRESYQVAASAIVRPCGHGGSCGDLLKGGRSKRPPCTSGDWTRSSLL